MSKDGNRSFFGVKMIPVAENNIWPGVFDPILHDALSSN